MHHGVRQLAELAARRETKLVLISQIYITRAAEHPDLAGIITARQRGEDAIRASGARYVIVRPAWLTDGPQGGVRIEQGDTGDGQVSRASVAAVVVASLRCNDADRTTFEIFDDPTAAAPDWSSQLHRLATDPTRDPTSSARRPRYRSN